MIASRHYIPLKHLRAVLRLGQLSRYPALTMNENRPTDATDEEWEYIQALADPNEDIRDNAAGALHALDAECAVPALLHALKSEPNEFIRGNYVYYLGYLVVHGTGEHDKLLIRTFDEVSQSETSQNVIDEMNNDEIRTIRERI